MSLTKQQAVLDEVSRAAFALLLKEPFFAHVLAGMPREVTGQVATVGTAWDGAQVRLRINPEFFLSVNAPQRSAVLKHEVLHVVFRHIFRGEGRDPQLHSIAADLVVNQLIDSWPLPDTYPTLGSFPGLNLASNWTLDQYYGALAQLMKTMGGEERRSTAAAGANSGNGGSHLGPRADAASPVASAASEEAVPNDSEALRKLLSESAGPRGDDSGWSSGESAVDVAARYAVGKLLLRARERLGPHHWGTLPKAIATELQLILAERQPKLDWRRIVRIFCASSNRTKIRHTVKRTSKRYQTRPGIRVKRLQRLLVAIDTSGSIDMDLLKDFFTEVHGAWRAGASVTVVECDAEVQRSYNYNGKPPATVQGGGGTAFDPVFRWMRDQRPYDGCLYLTDGYGPTPTTRPNCRLLWVLPTASAPQGNPLPFGPSLSISRAD